MLPWCKKWIMLIVWSHGTGWACCWQPTSQSCQFGPLVLGGLKLRVFTHRRSVNIHGICKKTLIFFFLRRCAGCTSVRLSCHQPSRTPPSLPRFSSWWWCSVSRLVRRRLPAWRQEGQGLFSQSCASPFLNLSACFYILFRAFKIMYISFIFIFTCIIIHSAPTIYSFERIYSSKPCLHTTWLAPQREQFLFAFGSVPHVHDVFWYFQTTCGWFRCDNPSDLLSLGTSHTAGMQHNWNRPIISTVCRFAHGSWNICMRLGKAMRPGCDGPYGNVSK